MPICNYVLAYNKLNLPWMEVEFTVTDLPSVLDLYFPVWRPGRYEEGKFMKNVRGLKFTLNGKRYVPERQNINHWLVSGHEGSELKVKYEYYAKDLNAGSTHCGEDLFYSNPVNACLYAEQLKNDPQHVELVYPKTWSIAGALPALNENGTYTFENIHRFFDTPFYASSSLKSYNFDLKGYDINIHFYGNVEPDFLRLRKNFVAFMAAQINDMGSLAVKEYHYIFIIADHKAYHGVEHLASTVLYLGPDTELFESGYQSLLDISSHEFYHSWNVKTIRPAEWMPYTYEKVSPSRLGYIAEGITTLMGDLYLLRSKVCDKEWFANEMGLHFTRYIQNFGRYRISVADSSYETWVDGYERGVPERKVSIYNEGALLAFIVEFLMRQHSDNRIGLIDLMREMYESEDVLKNGISEVGWKAYLMKYLPNEAENLFNNFYNGTEDYRYYGYDAMTYFGFETEEVLSEDFCEARIGFKLRHVGEHYFIASVYESSYASEFGICEGDELLEINGNAITPEVLKDLHDHADEEISLKLKHDHGTRNIVLRTNDRMFYKEVKVTCVEKMDIKQRQAYNKLADKNQ